MEAGVQQESFQGMRGFVELGHFDKRFVKNARESGSSGKNFGDFSLRYS